MKTKKLIMQSRPTSDRKHFTKNTKTSIVLLGHVDKKKNLKKHVQLFNKIIML